MCICSLLNINAKFVNLLKSNKKTLLAAGLLATGGYLWKSNKYKKLKKWFNKKTIKEEFKTKQNINDLIKNIKNDNEDNEYIKNEKARIEKIINDLTKNIEENNEKEKEIMTFLLTNKDTLKQETKNNLLPFHNELNSRKKKLEEHLENLNNNDLSLRFKLKEIGGHVSGGPGTTSIPVLLEENKNLLLVSDNNLNTAKKYLENQPIKN